MTDQTRWGILEVQTRNKAVKYQRDLVSRAMDQVVKMDESGITDLMIQIEAEYERKYGKKEAGKLVLQVSTGCRQGVDKVSTSVESVDNLALFQNDSKFSASKVYKCYLECRHLRHPSDPSATPQVSKLLFNDTNCYKSISPYFDTFFIF